MSLRLEIDEELERRFREEAMREFGYSEGSLKKASEMAISKWISEKSRKPIKKVDSPIKLIKGKYFWSSFSKIKEVKNVKGFF